jgi:hypothetical protein
MSKYEENPELLSDLKGVPKNIVEMAVAGASWNLKLSEYYVLVSIAKLRLTYGTKRNSNRKIM